jgi:hypothetical protein
MELGQPRQSVTMVESARFEERPASQARGKVHFEEQIQYWGTYLLRLSKHAGWFGADQSIDPNPESSLQFEYSRNIAAGRNSNFLLRNDQPVNGTCVKTWLK